MSTMTNAYEETNLVKTEFVQQFKAQSKRAMKAEEENVDLRMRLAESELKRVSTEAKVLAMMPESSARGGAKTKEEEEEQQQRRGKKRRSASPMVSPRRRSTRATSVDKEKETSAINSNDDAAIVLATTTANNNNNKQQQQQQNYSPSMIKREVEARELAETERDKLREQLLALKTRHAALEKKVMDDEGDELEDKVREENEVIEKLRKRLEKAETVNAELEMEVADLRGKRNERKTVEAKLEEALEMNEGLKSALEEEKKALLENTNLNSLPKSPGGVGKKGKGKKNDDEKEHTIRILRQEMKSLEASASRGDMLHSKMVSVEAVEERLRSTEAKLSRAKESVRAKEIENEKLQRALMNAGKWTSASLLDEGPEELKNRVGVLQTETIALSEKLAEATKALKVEQTKRELFESKAKEEEKLKDALEKELETAKMDALNAKSIVEAKDSEIASLQKMAENERKGEKILQTKSSPFTNEIIRGLEKEITRLKNNNGNNNNINNNTSSSSDDIISKLQKKEQRLLMAFKSTVLKFREAVKLLFGFNIELVGEKASKTQFLITSNANEHACLLFNYDEAKHSVSLEKNDPSWEKQSESLKKNFTLYVEKEDDDDKKKSIAGVPAFLSNWNMEFYNNNSVNK
ncbi:unknown protein [Bathycoccus prasinos]|uniref:Uncharacterized protein n=1 Tax=Bathycoccus prasinos TaxID=41875 RepID=K8EHZ4_9CHLO|nr:unknown protein [Bathycoccus prasinos]CCO17646.1 unknown protein [Bathycoccus prasinos]|eukprot:XP_007511525.1 unknown protein [Bathycoccus prasinos]